MRRRVRAVTRWIVRPPARRSGQPYRACDFGDDDAVTPRNRGARRPVGFSLAASLLVSACLGPNSVPASPSDAGPTSVAATVAASPSAEATPAPLSTPSTTQPPAATKPAPCPGTDRTPGLAGRRLTGSSTNWSGYVAAVNKTGVTCVEGSWVEPSVSCPRTGHQAVAIWIGIDGFSAKALGVPATSVLVQIGTQANCNDGVATHGAWHAILPGEAAEVPILATLHAGDHVSARISYASGQFTLVIYDREAAFSFSLTAPAPGAPRKTAEWIVEAPATHCPGTCAPVPLPKFTTITFTDARATIAGQRSSINDDSWSNVKLLMVRSGITRASTSSLSSHGTSFKVTFVHR